MLLPRAPLMPNARTSYLSDPRLIPNDMVGEHAERQDLSHPTKTTDAFKMSSANGSTFAKGTRRRLEVGVAIKSGRSKLKARCCKRVMPELVGHEKHPRAHVRRPHHCYREKPKPEKNRATKRRRQKNKNADQDKRARPAVGFRHRSVNRKKSARDECHLTSPPTPFFFAAAGYLKALCSMAMSTCRLRWTPIECAHCEALPRVPGVAPGHVPPAATCLSFR